MAPFNKLPQTIVLYPISDVARKFWNVITLYWDRYEVVDDGIQRPVVVGVVVVVGATKSKRNH